MRLAITMAAALILSGCGGSDGSDSEGDGEIPISIANRVVAPSAEAVNGSITVSWDAMPDADGYHIYYSSDPDFEIANYASYDHAGWIQGVESPHTFTPDPGPTYYVAVVGFRDDHESRPGRTEPLPTRYVIQSDSSVVLDIVTGLEWRRCQEGSAWDSGECKGEPHEQRFRDSEVLSLYPESAKGWRVPAKQELRTLINCTHGDPFPVKIHDPFQTQSGCINEYGGPGGTRLYPPVFPKPYFPYFWTSEVYDLSITEPATVTFMGIRVSPVRGDRHPGLGLLLVRDAETAQ